MKTPQQLVRIHYPEFIKSLTAFKDTFREIQYEHIKTRFTESGKPLTGNYVNPVISNVRKKPRKVRK
jgi:hypothetical protein